MLAALEIVGLAQARGLTAQVQVDPVSPAGVVRTDHVRPKVATRTAPGDWSQLLNLINEAQLSVLRLVKNRPGITVRQIAKELGVKPNQVTGVVNGGLQKNLPRAGFEVSEVLEIRQEAGEATYHPGPALLSNSLPGGEPTTK